MNKPIFTQLPTGVDPRRDTTIYSAGFPGRARNMLRFHKHYGRLPRPNNPTHFDDKIWARLLDDRRPVLQKRADKLTARDHVSNVLSSDLLPELYQVTNTVEALDLKTAPNQFVAKTNHGSGWTYIVPNKGMVDFDDLKSKLNIWLGQNYYDRKGEWAYKGIEPLAYLEELLVSRTGGGLNDYKFFCFDGVVEAIQVDVNRFNAHQKFYFTPTWQLIQGDVGSASRSGVLEPLKSYSRMKRIAELLSADLDFVRVDLYETYKGIMFGEFTIYPGAGLNHSMPKILGGALCDAWTLDSSISDKNI